MNAAKCPLCKGQPEVARNVIHFVVVCPHCGVRGPTKPLRRNAVIYWNKLANGFALLNEFEAVLKRCKDEGLAVNICCHSDGSVNVGLHLRNAPPTTAEASAPTATEALNKVRGLTLLQVGP